MRLSGILLSLVFASFLSSGAFCQDVDNTNATGVPDHAILNGSNFDSVQMNNGNLHIEIPLWSAKGRGMDSWGALVYDSKAWLLNGSCDQDGNCVDDAESSPKRTPGLPAYDKSYLPTLL